MLPSDSWEDILNFGGGNFWKTAYQTFRSRPIDNIKTDLKEMNSEDVQDRFLCCECREKVVRIYFVHGRPWFETRPEIG